METLLMILINIVFGYLLCYVTLILCSGRKFMKTFIKLFVIRKMIGNDDNTIKFYEKEKPKEEDSND